jgi:hypothetical protein
LVYQLVTLELAAGAEAIQLGCKLKPFPFCRAVNLILPREDLP